MKFKPSNSKEWEVQKNCVIEFSPFIWFIYLKYWNELHKKREKNQWLRREKNGNISQLCDIIENRKMIWAMTDEKTIT